MTAGSIDEMGRRGPGQGRAVLLVLTGAVLVAICFVFTFVMAGWYQDVSRGLGASGESVAAAVAQDVDRNIELLNFSLKAVAQQWGSAELQGLSPGLRTQVLFDSITDAPGFGMLMVLDATGTVQAHSRSDNPVGPWFGDRDYFRVHRGTRDLGLYVSKPFRSRVSNRWIVALSRRIDDAEGGFAGVAMGTIELAYLGKHYADVGAGPDKAITLYRTDGTVITREPFVPSDVRLWAGGGDAFNHMRATRTGTFEGASPIDGVPRIISFHRVGNLPLIQAVEVTGDAAYAGWWRRAVAVAGLLVLLCLVSMGLSVRLYRELGRRSAAEAELSRLAETDALTGLANRRRLASVLRLSWSRAAVTGRTIALLMIDADAFKAYNDFFGHQAGDGVLRAIAGTLEEGARARGGLASRCGGEEFVVLLPGLDEAGALATAEALRSAVQALALPHPRAASGVVTVSIGVAVRFPAQGGTGDEALEEADAALYRAKAEGRNCCRIRADGDRRAA
jgi:diguanylate cyclase (GGDEF)-like protein